MSESSKSPANGRLFGTDGIRGHASAFPLDPSTLITIGRALVETIDPGSRRRILIGRDTRESGSTIEEALGHGIAQAGAEPVSGGVLPTPAVALLTRAGDYGAGVVISASHNPWDDNGLKFFSGDGYKLSDETELAIERRVRDATPKATPTSAPTSVPQPTTAVDATCNRLYVAALRRALPPDWSLQGHRLVVDCAHGASHAIAPGLFESLGAEVTLLGCSPNGRNINEHCGSQHTEGVAAAVRRVGATVGIAFDGDADRCILVDEQGDVADGDDLLAVAATAMARDGSLGPSGVVGTVMANLGFESYLQSIAVGFIRTPVGDRHVLAEMRRHGARLGGEQSGHIIFLDHQTTGDGLLTSLLLLRFILASGRPLSALKTCWTRLPQLLRNVRVRERRDLDSAPRLVEHIRTAEEKLGDRGRVLVRFSGTEPLVRIMLEGPEAGELAALATDLARTVEVEFG